MSGLKNHILVPIDFSEQSLIALGQSLNLARLSKSDLTLINVIEDSFHLPFFQKKEDINLEKKIQEELDKLAKETSAPSGVKVNTLITKGKVYEEIQKTAKSLNAGFIVMGTNGSIGIKKFIGSNALRVIREAPCPVISIKGKTHRVGCRHIILPLDLTKDTREKISKSIEFAKLFGSTIHLLSVITNDDEFIVNKLRRQINQVKDYLTENEISCVTELTKGDDITESILEYAKKIEADLIMIMTREEMNLADIMFISSDAQHVINSSEIPVLSIRPKEKKNTTLSVFEY